MALEVRRIVTGHDSRGRAVVATDERIAGTGAAGGHLARRRLVDRQDADRQLGCGPAAKTTLIATITAAIQAAIAEERQQLTWVL